MPDTVVVTGAGDGIGGAIAERFLSAGARVHVCDIDGDRLAKTVEANEGLRGTVADVGDPADVARFIDDAVGWMGAVDVLVNNAGIAGSRAPLEEISNEEWDRVMRVNLHAMVYAMKRVIPGMKARGRGAIVNISTGSVKSLPVDRSVYNVSKAAVEGLTLTMARELGPFGVTVNAIRPGMVNNARMRGIVRRIAEQEGRGYDEVEAGFLRFVSMRTKIEPSEIADMAVFLASDQGRHVTGQVIAVDGGTEWEQ